jgi:nucleoside phosphorylase
MSFQPPKRRADFEVAIVCALKIEFEAVCFVVEEFWDTSQDFYGKAAGDANCYRTGRIGQHNVVLLLLSGVGKVNAANAAASLHSSFTGLRLVLLVGGCAAVPQSNDTEILLGDVIISTGVVQYDLGRMYPGDFVRKNTAGDSLSKPRKEIGNLLTALQIPHARDKLMERSAYLLTNLQRTMMMNGYGIKYQYPGVREDKLYEAGYRHKHRATGCSTCNVKDDMACEAALHATCEDLGCEETHLVIRKGLEKKLRLCQSGDASHQNPNIFFGVFGSGDLVMKSGEYRDTLARREEVIAFEMEAAGIWEEVPSLVIKGVFDYGDSHKSKRWQAFASATAACVARAIIEKFAWTDRGELQIPSHGIHYSLLDISIGHNRWANEYLAIEGNRAILGARQTNAITNATQHTSGIIKRNYASDKSEQSNIIMFASFWRRGKY